MSVPFIDANGNFVVDEATMLTKLDTLTINTAWGNKIIDPIPEWYCATDYGASSLQAWLKTKGITVTVVAKWPLFQNQAQSATDVQSAQVPWLDDGKGAVEEAGQLIYNFVNLPYSLAERTVLESFALDDTPQDN